MIKKAAFWWMLYAGFCVLLLVSERVQSARSGLAVTRMERTLKIKETRNSHIKFQLDTLKSPAQLEVAARARGLTAPDPDAVVTLPDVAPSAHVSSRWMARLFSREETARR
ncbi:MAG: hypothetical protein PHP45_11185 [Elusimicrobiales bacterium]|nr:hypothetical protein [Elusimicrobiales bacterium]